jgi:23S rRNA (cytosine1962-C5)-methyltransferase
MSGRIVLKKGRAKPLWQGHPWVYRQAIAQHEGDVGPGAVVDLVAHDGAFIGRGFVNLESSIAVRLLTLGEREVIDQAFFARRLVRARRLRDALRLPSVETNCYRLVNGEGDLLPGLIVDIYGDTVAVQFNVRGLSERAEMVIAALDELLRPAQIIRVARSSSARAEGPDSGAVIKGSGQPLVCKEYGVLFQVNCASGQKTGLFLDQRENRAWVARHCRGQRVLDLYCYQGGFGLSAAMGGAAEVLGVDASERAITAARENLALNLEGGSGNGLLEHQGRVRFETADAFQFLAADDSARYDLVVVDPPKFAQARKDLPSALKGYTKLFASALRVLRDDGLLCAAVCTQLISPQDLRRSLASAATAAGSTLRLVQQRGAGPDHPTLPAFPEGDYLQFLVCAVSRRSAKL